MAKAMTGEGDSPIAAVANVAMKDEFWMYSRFFGIGLVSLMEQVGSATNADDVYLLQDQSKTRPNGNNDERN